MVLQLSALEHVHNFGFVHRDIKPHNILFNANDRLTIHLIDFGIARQRLTDDLAPCKLPGHISVVGSLPWASLNSHYGFGELLNCSTLKLFKCVRAQI